MSYWLVVLWITLLARFFILKIINHPVFDSMSFLHLHTVISVNNKGKLDLKFKLAENMLF